MNKYKYIVASGWWCDNDSTEDRKNKYGNAELRKVDFFYKWYSSIKENTNANNIYVVDSNSPKKPDITGCDDITWIEMELNAGHSTNHLGKYCGVSLSFFTSMMRVYCSNSDYWVYIEQDALLKGKGIIEYAIDRMNGANIMYGSGWGTPQPVQQSLIIVKREYIPEFISRYCSIKSKDSEISPEYKFAIVCSPLLRILPECFFKNIDNGSLFSKIVARLTFCLANSLFSQAKLLPYGYGRVRPIKFSDDFLYFQHGNEKELDYYNSK
ncbi:hypothetical protein [Shewanella marisflavi]|uniref:hypothetical protein n=1 Tax=Shewanella marisflavi TaxID=260364 RepID=UPI003AB0C2E2